MYVLERNRVENRLKSYFSQYYDLNEFEASSEEYPIARYDLHASNRKFFLFKSAVIWEANCHEYVYIFSVNKLTANLYDKLEEYVHTEGMKLINPGKGHMYSYLTLFVVCDEYEKSAVKKLKSCHRRKDFKFGFGGWMELHTAFISCLDGNYATNHTGREYKKLLKNINK